MGGESRGHVLDRNYDEGRIGNIKGSKEQENVWTYGKDYRFDGTIPKVNFFLFTSEDVYVYISVLYLERDVFILPLTSAVAPVRRVNDDVQGKQLDSQTASH